MKTVMTLLVRDEQDILASNIDYHLAQGVDFIIATDNLSVDNTPDILREYESQGVLSYRREESDDYNQHAWVTRMAREAYTEHNADWVINNDADEFWWPLEGSLADTLRAVAPDAGTLEAARFNFVALADSDQETFFERQIYRDRISLNPLGKPLPGKVAHRGSSTVVVGQGNHSVRGVEPKQTVSGRVEILHFPIRSYTQLENKIVKGGAAYDRNTDLPQHVGNTWRTLYREYQANGHIRAYYSTQAYSEAALSAALEDGRVLVDTRLRDFLSELRRPAQRT